MLARWPVGRPQDAQQPAPRPVVSSSVPALDVPFFTTNLGSLLLRCHGGLTSWCGHSGRLCAFSSSHHPDVYHSQHRLGLTASRRPLLLTLNVCVSILLEICPPLTLTLGTSLKTLCGLSVALHPNVGLKLLLASWPER